MTPVMSVEEAVRARHAVRMHTGESITAEQAEDLRDAVDRCRLQGHLDMRLVLDDADGFAAFRTHYGAFRGVRDYVALFPDDAPDWDERCGYFGMQVMLRATQLGLDTCWARVDGLAGEAAGNDTDDAMTPLPRYVIALGHGARPGRPHRSKPFEQIASTATKEPVPEWFRRGIETVMFAPSALGRQEFTFRLEADGRTVTARALPGPCPGVDLGVAKLHFEIGAGDADFTWA